VRPRDLRDQEGENPGAGGPDFLWDFRQLERDPTELMFGFSSGPKEKISGG